MVRHGVNFVVIGGWAIEAQGFEFGYKTTDIDFTPYLGAGNLYRLSAALYDLGADIRFDNQRLPFDHDGESLGRVAVWNLTCDDGDFDLTFEPSGLDGYQSLIPAAHKIIVEADGEQFAVLCADLGDIVRSKRTADRPKDNEVLPLLEAHLDAERQRSTRQHPDTAIDVGP